MQDYAIERDPCLREFPCEYEHISSKCEHIQSVFQVTSDEKSFIVYCPSSMDPVDIRGATTEIFEFPFKCRYVMSESRSD